MVPREREPLRIAVLISGGGTNLQAIIDAISSGELNAVIVSVIASRPDAHGLKRAQEAGIQTISLNRAVYADPAIADEALVSELVRAGAEYVIMAGYMRKVTDIILDVFPDRVVNVHPALLPSFKGAHAIRDAYEFGVKMTGVTVHFANAEYDKGPIIAQRAVPVLEGDTLEQLEQRIHETEHALYPEVIGWLADGRISIDGDRRVHVCAEKAR